MLCRAVERPEWLTDPRFARPRDRAANAAELIAELDQIFAARPLAEWAESSMPNRTSSGRRSTRLEDVLGDDQFHAAGGVVYVPDGESSVPAVATPADFLGTPWEPRSPAPELGQHTEEVLAELKARGALGS